jgi:predicted O-methyltransferase YrrM
MKIKSPTAAFLLLSAISLLFTNASVYTQDLIENPELDKKVKAFLAEHDHSWRDMNVPTPDGQLLYDLIIKNNYKNAVEIGTSTGHSGIWMAWALSKTGGKLITLEIDERRYKEALANFKKAGVLEYIDARLGDAHEMVPQLTAPIDFVFSDADKSWYTNYFKAIAPKLEVGGCFVSHNISSRHRQAGITEYINYIESLSHFRTKYNNKGAGVSISYKTGEK